MICSQDMNGRPIEMSLGKYKIKDESFNTELESYRKIKLLMFFENDKTGKKTIFDSDSKDVYVFYQKNFFIHMKKYDGNNKHDLVVYIDRTNFLEHHIYGDFWVNNFVKVINIILISSFIIITVIMCIIYYKKYFKTFCVSKHFLKIFLPFFIRNI